MNITHIVRSLGGKATGKTDEWLLNCWRCDGQQKLYFNVKKNIGFCQKCSKPMGLQELLQEAGISLNLSKQAIAEFIKEARDNEVQDVGVRDYVAAKLFSKNSAFLTVEGEAPAAAMPQHYFTLEEGQSLPDGRKALQYLLNRGFQKSVLFDLQFGFCVDGKYGGRIIVPFWENNKIVYWQARDFTNTQKPKILNPYSEHCKLGKSDVLFNYDKLKRLEVVVICESWGSALAVGTHATGINGKHLSSVQLRKLLQLPASLFIVLLDAGAEVQASAIAKTLSESRKVLVATLPYGDPNEVPKAVLNQAVADAQRYSTGTLLRSMTVSLNNRVFR